jgi:enoyl-CoA hydratase
MVADVSSLNEQPPVLCRTRGALGRITLNRPHAINALNLEMIHALAAALDALETDPAVNVVVLDGAGPRGLCAGADILALRASALGDGEAARQFWRDEYKLVSRIARYPKPVVSIMDGVTMGGGVGLAGHASHRIVTDRVVWAMPEVTIGLIPDVGGTWLLSRTPGETGTHLALTGERIGADDAVALGLADAFIPHESVEFLVERLCDGDVTAVTDFAQETEESPLRAYQALWDQCYAGDDARAIVARLHEAEDSEADRAAQRIEAASPSSVTATLAGLRKAPTLPDLEACLALEYELCCLMLQTPDFPEGVRAAVVDKDRTPHWSPASLAHLALLVSTAYFRGPTGDRASN